MCACWLFCRVSHHVFLRFRTEQRDRKAEQCSNHSTTDRSLYFIMFYMRSLFYLLRHVVFTLQVHLFPRAARSPVLPCGTQTYRAAVAILKPSRSCCDGWQLYHSEPEVLDGFIPDSFLCWGAQRGYVTPAGEHAAETRPLPGCSTAPLLLSGWSQIRPWKLSPCPSVSQRSRFLVAVRASARPQQSPHPQITAP